MDTSPFEGWKLTLPKACPAYAPPYAIIEINTAFGTGDVRGWRAMLARRNFEGAAAVGATSANLRRRLLQLSPSSEIGIVPRTVDETFCMLPATERGGVPFVF